MKILGVIPARGGSKELPRKNLLKIGSKSLLELAFQSSWESKLLTRTILSSDDDEIISEGVKCGCEVLFKRPDNISTDTASVFAVLKHALNWLGRNEKWEPSIIVLLQPTTPFRKGEDIDGVINLLINTQADAAMTVRKPNYPPHWMLSMNKEKVLKNLIKDGNKFMRRQDTPSVFQPAGSVYAFKTKIIHQIDNRFPFENTRGYQVNQESAVNIDTQLDYELAKAVYKKSRSKS